ncbi:MAG TPA: metallopeptidase TldD-related protein [Polyangia bacterium]|nr:metallopeptidase TldD-related protein [Polyangia bacterium]
MEGGGRAYPVGEITISLNFDALWKGIDAVGDDLDTRSSVQCPSFRVGAMMIAGS